MKRKSNHTTHLITTLNRVLRKYKRLFSKNTKGVTTSFCKKKTTLENRIKHLIAVVKKQTTAAGFATAMLVAAPFISQGQQFQLVSDNPFVFTSQDRYESPDLVDIDADGDLDLLYFKYQDPYLVLFENIGTASNPVFDTAQIAPFGLPTSYAGYDLVYCNSSFVDIDADGDYDMYLGDGYGRILFIENTGTAATPSFGSITNTAMHTQAQEYFFNISFVDMDGDGDYDAFAGNEDGELSYFINNGSPTSPSFVLPLSGFNPLDGIVLNDLVYPSFADIDSDGDFDAFFPNGDWYSEVLFYENAGTPSSPQFIAPQANPFGLNGFSYYSPPSFADIDADGDLDVLSGWDGCELTLQKNTGSVSSPEFAQISNNPWGFAGGCGTLYISLADIDGDGDSDCLIGSPFPGGATGIYENIGSPTVPIFSNYYYLTGYVPEAVNATADIDGDGDFDLFVSRYWWHDIFFSENTGTPNTPSFASLQSSLSGMPTLPEVGFIPTLEDFDNDGDFDILSGSWYGGIFYMENTGSPTVPAFGSYIQHPFGLFADTSRPSLVAPFDADSDGDLDVLISHFEFGNLPSQSPSYYENTGTATTPAFQFSNINALFDISHNPFNSIAFADLDNDGVPEAMATGENGLLFYDQLPPIQTCDQPTSVSVNTAATTATMNWALEPDATATQIQYRVHPSFGGSPPNTVIAGAGATSQALSGLQSATMYQSRLRHNCDSIGISPWKFRTFMTAPMRLGQSDRISTYPNPANDVVNIAISNDAHLEVKITDLFGREMIVGKTSGSNLLTLNVSALQAGVYLVEVGHDFENASTELLQIIR